MGFQIGDYSYLFLLLVLPFLGYALYYYVQWTKKRRTLFAEERFHEGLFEKKNWFSKVFPILYGIAILFLVLSFLDFVKGGDKMKVKQKMNNVIFMLDVSNSMNAEDVEPTRLVQAKNIMLNIMSKMNNDRVGVVIFAGDAVSIMPLTTDYNAVESYVSGIETSTMKVQGTDFLKAMEVTIEKFKNINKGARKVVLISDGEDNEGNEEAAIDLAKKEGVRVFSVGVGTAEGAPIPEYIFGQFMGYKTKRNGEPIMTKKQTKALENIAKSTKGKYLDVTNLDATTTQVIEQLNKGSDFSEVTIDTVNRKHYYQYFLGIALLSLFLIYFFNPKRDFNV